MSSVLVSQVRDALIDAGITGRHRSHERSSTIRKVEQLASGADVDARFGLSGIEGLSASEIFDAMVALTGCPSDITDIACEDWIDPDLTVAGIVAAAERLRDC